MLWKAWCKDFFVQTAAEHSQHVAWTCHVRSHLTPHCHLYVFTLKYRLACSETYWSVIYKLCASGCEGGTTEGSTRASWERLTREGSRGGGKSIIYCQHSNQWVNCGEWWLELVKCAKLCPEATDCAVMMLYVTCHMNQCTEVRRWHTQAACDELSSKCCKLFLRDIKGHFLYKGDKEERLQKSVIYYFYELLMHIFLFIYLFTYFINEHINYLKIMADYKNGFE